MAIDYLPFVVEISLHIINNELISSYLFPYRVIKRSGA